MINIFIARPKWDKYVHQYNARFHNWENWLLSGGGKQSQPGNKSPPCQPLGRSINYVYQPSPSQGKIHCLAKFTNLLHIYVHSCLELAILIPMSRPTNHPSRMSVFLAGIFCQTKLDLPIELGAQAWLGRTFKNHWLLTRSSIYYVMGHCWPYNGN